MNPIRLYRLFIKTILISGLLIALFITYQAYITKEWATVASALSVITAVLAIWISLNLTWQQEDEKQPQVIVYIDNISHKYAYSLVIRNEGGSPAYNVNIEWINPIYDSDEKIPRFTDFEDDYDLHYIKDGTSYSRFLFGANTFRKMCDTYDKPLLFDGIVSYTKSPKSKFRFKKNFKLSLEAFKKRLNVQDDQMDFYFENKKLTSQLKEINSTILKLNHLLERNNTDEAG